jgi:putative glutamine amidotransferase
MTRPRIGITRAEDVPGEAIEDYHRRVREAGGEPIDLALEHYPEPWPPEGVRLADDIRGLILTGGVDIDPYLYGETPHPKVRRTNRRRDEFEIALLRDALARDLPVFAICRGHQLLNVALEGSLLQHIDGDGHRAHYEQEGYPSRWHIVRFAEGSRVRTLLHTDEIEANSRHHQAVLPETLSPSLRATGFSPDGIVEVVESPRYRWLLGVQCHPEREEVAERFAPLFAALVQAASYGSGRG